VIDAGTDGGTSAPLPVEDRARLTTGADLWRTRAEPRLGLPSLRMSDGPNGVRGDTFDERVRSWCTPCGTALAASWDEDLVRDVGSLLGEEARRMGVDVLLGPTVNVHRSPLGGRGFECFSEDPLLSGRMAAAWVGGVQGRGVGASPKHFVGNDSETSRTTVDCVIGERALRELYLVPFEHAVRAGAWALMAAYNKVNGVYATEHAYLVKGILKGEWQWDGLLMSDWLAARDTLGCALGGLDLEMPAGPVMGAALAAEVRAGRLPEGELDDKVARLVRLARRVRAGRTAGAESPVEDGGDEAAMLVRAAAGGFVLLQNDGLLPLLPDRQEGVLAVIGPNATDPCFQGGGAAAVNMGPVRLPLEALTERYAHVEYERGAAPRDTYRPLELLDVRTVEEPVGPGLLVTYVVDGGRDGGGAQSVSEVRGSSFLSWYDGIAAFAAGSSGVVRMSAVLIPERTGRHDFSVRGSGPTELRFGGVSVASLTGQARADDMFAAVYANPVGEGSVLLEAGVPVNIEATMRHVPHGIPVFEVGCRAPVPQDLLDRAVALAARAQAVVLVVGTSSDVDSESADRTDTALPGAQDDLVREVLRVNPRTAVVVNAGSAVDLPWAPAAAAILYTWLPGHGFADALASVLSGDLEPGGRLPITLAATPEQYPAYDTTPDSSGRLTYTESVFVGYRHLDEQGLVPAFPFGHGLGYTRFEYGDLTATGTVLGPGGRVELAVSVRNMGDRPGKHVLQVYVTPPRGQVPRPPRELRDLAAVTLAPAEQRRVRFSLGPEAFAYWDETRRAWRVAAGQYAVVVAGSSRDPGTSALVTALRGFSLSSASSLLPDR